MQDTPVNAASRIVRHRGYDTGPPVHAGERSTCGRRLDLIATRPWEPAGTTSEVASMHASLAIESAAATGRHSQADRPRVRAYVGPDVDSDESPGVACLSCPGDVLVPARTRCRPPVLAHSPVLRPLALLARVLHSPSSSRARQSHHCRRRRRPPHRRRRVRTVHRHSSLHRLPLPRTPAQPVLSGSACPGPGTDTGSYGGGAGKTFVEGRHADVCAAARLCGCEVYGRVRASKSGNTSGGNEAAVVCVRTGFVCCISTRRSLDWREHTSRQ
ncbi:hypothetical protein K466DRAFT_93724 [Polyporus arcularius HHB13444]|uniref:Uncharacterized protein n=1 Tax=Polyporus arcularius HHB13444 TaxID=1314778 RepID=A0A5C3NXM5_9APHY|nr:hypothetical protein K466DRAFT_93724 [Polyporus arcularius HHB13444]